jgi:outer membrane protein assembly factor BamB
MKIAALVLAAVGLSGGDTAEDKIWNWRGPNRDGLSPDTGLLKEWPAGGPPLAWKATGIGRGYSSVSVAGDRLLTMGDVDRKAHVLCLSAADGKLLWKSEVGRPGDGPRCTPATDGKIVVALAQHGELVCADLADGRVLWTKHLVKDFGGEEPPWMYCESPLLDGQRVVCKAGGRKDPQGTVVALDKSTGEKIWQSRAFPESSDPKERNTVDHSSIITVELAGVRQYVVLTKRTVAGLRPETGEILWTAEHPGRTAVCTTPLGRDGIVFVTSDYGVGSNAFRIVKSGEGLKAEKIYFTGDIKNHHGGITLVGDHVYGTGGDLRCVDFKTGKLVWKDKSVGKGSIAYADGHFVVRSEKGPIALVEATPAGYKEKGRFDQPDRSKQESWPHPVIFGGRMYIRDQDVLLCYDVKAK